MLGRIIDPKDFQILLPELNECQVIWQRGITVTNQLQPNKEIILDYPGGPRGITRVLRKGKVMEFKEEMWVFVFNRILFQVKRYLLAFPWWSSG